MKKTIITAILATIILTGLGGNLRAQAVASLADDTIALGDQTTLSIRNALNYPSAEMLTAGGMPKTATSERSASRLFSSGM